MALAPPPAPAALAGDPAAVDAAPMAGADDMGSGETVLVTISATADGSFVVYDGDEAEGSGADMSAEDAEAGAGAPGATGQPADSIGAALKIAMDILQAHKSAEGAPGTADDQFAAGFGASKAPTPATGPSARP